MCDTVVRVCDTVARVCDTVDRVCDTMVMACDCVFSVCIPIEASFEVMKYTIKQKWLGTQHQLLSATHV